MVVVRRFQLVDQFAFFALVVDFLGEVELFVNQEPLPRSQLLATKAVHLRKATVDFSAMPREEAHLLKFLLADMTDETKMEDVLMSTHKCMDCQRTYSKSFSSSDFRYFRFRFFRSSRSDSDDSS